MTAELLRAALETGGPLLVRAVETFADLHGAEATRQAFRVEGGELLLNKEALHHFALTVASDRPDLEAAWALAAYARSI